MLLIKLVKEEIIMRKGFSWVCVPIMMLALLVVSTSGCASDGPAEPGEATSAEAAIVLAGMHGDIMESIEEAFAYTLLGDTEEKTDFESKMADFDNRAEQFQSIAGLSQADSDTFAQIITAKENVTASAEAMFAEYESGGGSFMLLVNTFEADIDALTDLFGPFTKSYVDRVEQGSLEADKDAAAALDLLLMHKDIMEAIEESLAYVLMDAPEEKVDFQNKMDDFKQKANEFAALEYCDPASDDIVSNLYYQMLSAKDDMYAAAVKMFGDFEAEGQVTHGDVANYEVTIDELTSVWEALLAAILE